MNAKESSRIDKFGAGTKQLAINAFEFVFCNHIHLMYDANRKSNTPEKHRHLSL